MKYFFLSFILSLLLFSCESKKKDTKREIREVIDKDVITEKQLPKKINIKYFEEESAIDILIDREELKTYLDFEFNYDKFEVRKENNKDQISYYNKNFKVFISKKIYDKSQKVNDGDYYGVNYDTPNEVVSSVEILFKDQKIGLDKVYFKDLAEPDFTRSNVYQIDDKNIIIEMNNSDGAGGYAAYFFINNKGEVERYIVFP
ncbi:hypothetical protein [Tenacibaculum sp. IB213877]|uniref:hypothetical protein n=1 Tax=Tenacibaculum sp. IB213877 TaxID=3097351 RepID=UPI002A5AB6DE|nr:hypothetical protein [Tenacibaculum sp. IB213877]MDY0779192.1 hypothetical protein [Tenacibaculum sp. IB213877]